jgi:hypothetical protein
MPHSFSFQRRIVYGWLYFDNNFNALGAHFYFCDLVQPPTMKAEALTSRRKRVAALIEQQCKALAAGRRDAVSSYLKKLVVYLPDQDFELGLHMGLAHMMLPDAQRQQRVGRMERLLSAGFAEAMPLSPKLNQSVELLRTTAQVNACARQSPSRSPSRRPRPIPKVPTSIRCTRGP